ncbi:hypothetical protein BDZ91DRAFT_448119 [Kalaharituber pfeilii]|nr:hypothetical protein BDZ91DRAFT_448119 [Kalaharituber pfeilii]
MMPPQQQKDLSQNRDMVSRYQTFSPTIAFYPEQRSQAQSDNISPLHQSRRYYQQRQNQSYREPPKSATFPPRRDWPGRDEERGSDDWTQVPQTAKAAAFPPIPPTATQRAHDKLDRLAAEASSVVEEISSSQGNKGAGDTQTSDRSSSAGSTNLPAVNASHQQRLQQLSDFYVCSQSYSNSSTTASTPTSATSMTSQFARNLPRTSSIDSTLSNSSSHAHGHSHSSSSGSTVQGSSPQDIANLIAAAGSAEAVIQVLLKDKASAQSQNTQLWRLVDKQRAMILGLNKDLERALKDKERYRRKLKEHLAMFPQLQGESRATTESPAPSEQAEGHSPHDLVGPEINGLPRAPVYLDRHGSIELDVTPYPVTPPIGQRKSENGSNPSMQEHEQIPSPTPHIHAIAPASDPLATPNPNRPQMQAQNNDYRAPSESLGSDLNAPDFSTPLKSPRREMVRLNVDTNGTNTTHLAARLSSTAASSSHLNNPFSSDSVTPISVGSPLSASSAVSLDKGPMSPERTKKKGPPARLELRRTERMPFQATRGSDNDESNYDEDDDDDDISVEEISGYEERRRELEMQVVREKDENSKEAEAPEKIEDTKHPEEVRPDAKPMAQQDIPRKDSATVPLSAVIKPENVTYDKPMESKLGISGLLALKQAPGTRPPPLSFSKLREVQEAESVGLSPLFPPGQHRESMITHRILTPRPMSPGLPSSPRPSPNSPLPRPRRNISYPEPLSPRATPRSPGLTLPASPRVGLMPGPLNPQGGPNTPLQATFAATGLGLVPLSPSPYGQEWSSLPSHRLAPNSVASPVTELLIEPSAISTIEPRVVSSRMRPSRASFLPGKHKSGPDDSVFTIGIFSKTTGKEMWRVEKDAGALPALDARLRQCNKDLGAKLPDRSLFNGHAPARVDARRAAIEEYFTTIMDMTMDEATSRALCEFFSVDVVESPASEQQPNKDDRNSADGSTHGPTKEGYLTKRGKNFGGWKARYFILDGPVLRYFESPGGTHLGSIKLSNAQIGRQQQKESQSQKEGDSELEAENQYRHAFLILEPKRKDSCSLVKHVLCAENDAERDEWVEALMQWVEKSRDEPKHKGDSASSKEGKKKKDKKEGKEKSEEDLRAVSYDDVVPGAAPARGPTPDNGRYRSPTPTSGNYSLHSSSAHSIYSVSSTSPLVERGASSKVISGPTNGSIISDAAAWGNQTDKAQKEAKALKKRSIWGFRGRSSSDLSNEQKPDPHNKIPPGRMVFGVSLEEAIAVSRPFGVTAPLPAVVYRCIEYLDAKNAVNEEGIFRLSGSNLVIKGLRDRFNSESDVNLLASEEYDVHAVAGLLKLYLRELPTNILTSERRNAFLEVIKQKDKIAALNRLVHQLPIENFTLLKALSGHLIRIVDNAAVNLMTVKNVGIVFSPTLNIPPPVFALFLQEHHSIFNNDREKDYAQEDNESSRLQTQRSDKPRQQSFTLQERPTLEPPKSHTAPLSPSIKPAYDIPHYDRPPHYDQSQPNRASYLPDSNQPYHIQQPHSIQQQMQEQLQKQQNAQLLQLQPSNDSLNSNSDVKSAKARRRESSMLSVMGMGGMRKSMLPPRTPQGTGKLMAIQQT